MSFSDQEVAYLRSQRLARLATVAPDGQPDVVPVGFEFDERYLYVGGLDPARTRKFRNVQAGNTKVALVVDDLASVRPWSPRYLRIYGTAELVERPGQFGHGPYMQITPTISWSFNLDGRLFTHDRGVVPRRTVHHAADAAGSSFAPPAQPGAVQSGD
jgi:pyridoxamine 5'-phosphate oxidase family protein